MEKLNEMIEEAGREVREDDERWTRLACGQDTEEAEQSGRLVGHLEGLKAARELLTADEKKLHGLQVTEHQAWLALVQEMRQAGVGDINPGGRYERLVDAICAWGEELAQLRINGSEHVATAALARRREKYLGVGT